MDVYLSSELKNIFSKKTERINQRLRKEMRALSAEGLPVEAKVKLAVEVMSFVTEEFEGYNEYAEISKFSASLHNAFEHLSRMFKRKHELFKAAVLRRNTTKFG